MKSKIIFIIMLLLVIASISAFAALEPGGQTEHVGAPLDGGLLSILGAAGVAYITARRRKKKGAN